MEKQEALKIEGKVSRTNMSKLNVQYSSTELLRYVFRCKICKYPLVMYGCTNQTCENYYKKNIKNEK